MRCFCSGRRRKGRGWTNGAIGLHHLHHVWTDCRVAVLSLQRIDTQFTVYTATYGSTEFITVKAIVGEWCHVNSQCRESSTGLCETDEQAVSVFLRKKTVWLMPMANARLSYLHWAVQCSLASCTASPYGTHCSLQRHGHRAVGHKTWTFLL